jgi:hypothetical protein
MPPVLTQDISEGTTDPPLGQLVTPQLAGLVADVEYALTMDSARLDALRYVDPAAGTVAVTARFTGVGVAAVTMRDVTGEPPPAGPGDGLDWPRHADLVAAIAGALHADGADVDDLRIVDSAAGTVTLTAVFRGAGAVSLAVRDATEFNPAAAPGFDPACVDWG